MPKVNEQSGAYSYSILLNDLSLPVLLTPGQIGIIITENIRQKLPSGKFVIFDHEQLYKGNNPINDGTKLKIAIGDGNSNTISYGNFVAFGTPHRVMHSSGTPALLVPFILDNHNYLSQTVNQSFTGASSSVISQIASKLNMPYYTNDSTNDSMTWRPSTKSWSKFVKFISDHSWTDSKSVFFHGVDSSNTLYFVNIQKLFENRKPKMIFVRGYDQSKDTKSQLPYFNILDYYAASRSGQFNSEGAYNSRTTQTNGDGSVSIYNQVSASKNANTQLDINKKVAYGMQNRGKIRIAPFDCGNGHANYINALHQNERLRLTYSQNLYILVQGHTGVSLFDIVIVKVYSNGDIRQTVSNIYAVTAKSKLIHGAIYYEKIELTTMGISNQNAELY